MRPEAPTIHPKRAGPESGTLRHLAGSHALRAPVDALTGRMDERGSLRLAKPAVQPRDRAPSRIGSRVRDDAHGYRLMPFKPRILGG